ncbi:2OG-Fe(II) oxygenase [Rickettsia endosymbiont of Gonocerus acuteangulatus]|uniref:2OG-Fe(II) oxygenase n=1 Tax=Rickettsia endosymbiont of Gonocerus acuteangulatus TaxID=3066266 RepID=UPI0031330973
MPSGILDVHVDGNYHDATGLSRRMNVILYLNPNWQKGWSGEFGIYNENGDKYLKRVEPLFNVSNGSKMIQGDG